MTLIPAPDTKQAAADLSALRAKAALVRKKTKTPLEDSLAADGGQRAVRLVQWARQQKASYDASLVQWRANRLRWAQEAQDIFDHRAAVRKDRQEMRDNADIFEMANDSINIVASLAEFASAQCEQDIYGGEPWFAAKPIGNTDTKLADDIQKHLQWTFRDGRFVDSQCLGIDQAVTLGECFTKMLYAVDTDEYEKVTPCLHVNGKPFTDANGQYVTTNEQTAGLKFKKDAKLEWKDAFEKKTNIIRQGVEAIPIHFNDISFREDAPELDLRHTNVYLSVEMSVFEAMRRFHLSKEDALRLATVAQSKIRTDQERQREITADATVTRSPDDDPLGVEESEKLLNARVRLVEAYIRADAIGDGKESRMCIVFPPHSEDWIIWADYLANVSPKAELPIKCDVWEPVPHKLYGRGFFSKYAYLQTSSDNYWNQVNFRNGMAANPVTAIHPENIESDDDTGAIVFAPGLTIKPKAGKKLADCIEFAEMPDMDQRSMELLNTGIQLAQMRSGISSASQGDMSALPENNTATGVRALMSRAAILLKKPIRRMRRSRGRCFSLAVKLHYANFDREEAFTVGEGDNTELIKITPEQVRDLDIDVVMLMTQEQDQDKLAGSREMMNMETAYAALPEIDKAGARIGVVQALKALQFSNPEEMVRQPVVDIQSMAALLPPDQQALLQQAMLALQQQQSQSTTAAAESSPPQSQTETPPTTPLTP